MELSLTACPVPWMSWGGETAVEEIPEGAAGGSGARAGEAAVTEAPDIFRADKAGNVLRKNGSDAAEAAGRMPAHIRSGAGQSEGIDKYG